VIAAGVSLALPHLRPWLPGFAFGFPFLVGALLMPWAIGRLARAGMGQRIRAEGPQSHLAKGGTPTGGGLAIVGLLLATLLLLDRHVEVLPAVGALLLGATLGLVDDLVTVRGAMRGLKARQKIVIQAGIGAALGFWFLRLHQDVQLFPFTGHWRMGGFIVPVAAFALVAASNAFNLTDGSDGLAPGVMLILLVFMALIARHLGSHHEAYLVRAMLAAAGALGAFLLYNAPPARAFMGGIGSEGLGLFIAALAISSGLLWLLPLLALVPVMETLSVIIQVYFFQTQKRRVFRMSPLHHHFHLGGWSEWRVAMSAWGVTAAAGVVGFVITGHAR
jgi:phospho-N-acetylmuramoyl-pentapeptide-transferase